MSADVDMDSALAEEELGLNRTDPNQDTPHDSPAPPDSPRSDDTAPHVDAQPDPALDPDGYVPLEVESESEGEGEGEEEGEGEPPEIAEGEEEEQEHEEDANEEDSADEQDKDEDEGEREVDIGDVSDVVVAEEVPAPASGAGEPVAAGSAKPGKPKSRRAPRSRSPTPPPPPPPSKTIRLRIALGGPSNYEVDVRTLAQATGQLPAPPPAPEPISEVEAYPTTEAGPSHLGGQSEVEGDGKKKRRRRKKADREYYDLEDPFIDDSDLALDERTYFAQTKQQGFYVSSGEIALLKEKTPKKPRSRAIKIPLLPIMDSASNGVGGYDPGPISVKHEGTRDSPIAVPSDGEDDKSGLKRKASIGANGAAPEKKRRLDFTAFHPEVQRGFEQLKVAVGQENWEKKGKFPPSIKPLLAQVALTAVRLNEYDDYFFNMMPKIFPYNRFTMQKLIKRTIFADHVHILSERQDSLLDQLKRLADDGFAKAKEDWERSVASWHRKREQPGENVLGGSADGTPVGDVSMAEPAEDGSGPGAEADSGTPPPASTLTQSGDAAGERGTHPPVKKFRLTETMRAIIWALVQLSNECCRIENEKNSLEGSTVAISDQGLRKVLYQKIIGAFPDGWMTSGYISREVSVMKKKYEREDKAEAEDG